MSTSLFPFNDYHDNLWGIVSSPDKSSLAERKTNLVSGLFGFCSKHQDLGTPIRLLCQSEVYIQAWAICYRYNMAVSAVWLIQYRIQGAQPQRGALYKLYGTWQACYVYYISQGWGACSHCWQRIVEQTTHPVNTCPSASRWKTLLVRLYVSRAVL